MDNLEKVIAQEHISLNKSISFTSSPLGFGTVKCNGVIIGSSIQQSLYHSILHSKMVSRLSILLKIPEYILLNTVHWKVLSTARKEARLTSKIFISKWVSKTTATGIVMVQRKQRLLSNCPLCNLPDEDTTHVLQCQSSSAISLKTNLLSELECWMQAKNTHPDIKTFIIIGIEKWFNSSSQALHRHIHNHLNTAFKHNYY